MFSGLIISAPKAPQQKVNKAVTFGRQPSLGKLTNDIFTIQFGNTAPPVGSAPVVDQPPKTPEPIREFYRLMYRATLNQHGKPDADPQVRQTALHRLESMLREQTITPNTIPYFATTPTPLGYAGAAGDIELMDLFYEYGADVNLCNIKRPHHGSGATRPFPDDKPADSVLSHTLFGDPLHGSSMVAIRWVLDKPELSIGLGDTEPKSYAELFDVRVKTAEDATTIYQWFMDHGADLNTSTNSNQVPVLHAMIHEDARQYTGITPSQPHVRALLTLDADPAIQDGQGNNALHHAVLAYIESPDVTIPRDLTSIINLLLEHDSQEHPLKTTRNNEGQTPVELLQTKIKERSTEDRSVIGESPRTDELKALLTPN